MQIMRYSVTLWGNNRLFTIYISNSLASVAEHSRHTSYTDASGHVTAQACLGIFLPPSSVVNLTDYGHEVLTKINVY